MTRNSPWRKDNPNAVIVDRRTKWGNPYRVGEFDKHYDCTVTQESAVTFFEVRLDTLKATSPQEYDEFLAPLRGKDLACWCSLSDKCHADVLLKLANEVSA